MYALRHWRRLGLVAALSLVAVFAGAAAASADAPTSPPFATTAVYSSGGGSTGWSSVPRFFVADPRSPGSGQAAVVWMGEPYQSGGYLMVPWQWSLTVPNDTSGQYFSIGFQFQAICKSTSSGNTVMGAATPSGSMFNLASNPTGWPNSTAVPTSGSNVANLTGATNGACATGYAPYGVVAQPYTATWPQGSSTRTYATVAQRMVWYTDAASSFGQTDFITCRALFGPDYTDTTTAVINGQTVTASAWGCGTDIITDPGSSTSFDVVCAGAPHADWLTWSWLPAWIGHYATCLFNPAGGWDPNGDIAAAYGASAIKPLQDAVSGLGSTTVSGTCGDIVNTTLLGASFRVSTCDAGWNSYGTVRTMLGVVFVAGGGIGALLIALRAFGFHLGSKGGDDE